MRLKISTWLASLALLVVGVFAAATPAQADSGDYRWMYLGGCQALGGYINTGPAGDLYVEEDKYYGCWHYVQLKYYSYTDHSYHYVSASGWQQHIIAGVYSGGGSYGTKTGNITVYAWFEMCTDPESGPCTSRYSYNSAWRGP